MPQNLNVFAMNMGELETEVLRKLWVNPSEDSNGFPSPSAFQKYTKYRIDKKLNKCYTEMVTMSRALRGWFIITLKANYSQYPVPLNCFGIDEVYYFDTATTYTPFDIYEEDLVESRLSSGWQTYPSTPICAYVGDRNKMKLKLGVAPAPNKDGTAPTFASGLVQSYQPYGVLEAVSGAAAPGSAANTYIDSSSPRLQLPWSYSWVSDDEPNR